MQRLTSNNYTIMPWKNGGGTTTELASSLDQDESTSDFLWRISIAHVASDGPFSKFDGYDRILTMIKGNGMQLGCEEADDLDVSHPFMPHAFSGDWAIDGKLNDGPIDNFNLIFDRSKAKGQVVFCSARNVVQHLDQLSDIVFLHNISDQVSNFQFGAMNPSDSLLIKEKTPLSEHLKSEDESQMALVQIIKI